jgi:hypothetical protein
MPFRRRIEQNIRRRSCPVNHRLRILLLVASAFGLFALPAVASAQTPTLRGHVGTASSPDSLAIGLTRADGSPLGQLDPGTYTIVIEDYSTIHNFHLLGPGVDMATGVEQTGTVTWTVTLSDGTYRFRCDVHPVEMQGSFRIGPPPPAPPAPTRLNASVGPGNTISLRTAAGARVRSLPAGRYRIVVRDRSRRHNFRLTGPGIGRATGVRFRGTVTWTLNLRAGAYRFFSVPQARRVRGSFRVR